MISCAGLTEQLFDFISGDLPAETRHEIEIHFRQCPPCLAFYRSYSLIMKLCRLLPAQPLPPDLAQRLLTQLRGEPS